MKIFNKISFFLSLLVLFSFIANNAFAAKGAANVYKVTVYRLVFCETGSSLTNCSNGDEVEHRAAGLTMDIASVDAGAVAGSFGNLSKLTFGKTYSHGEVILDRKFVIAGSGLSEDGEECQTSSSAGAGTKSALGNGATGLTPGTNEQTLYITNSSSLSTNINGTTATDGTGTDGADGVVASGDDYVKFRWAFAAPFTMKNKVPTMYIEFNVSEALGFYAEGELPCTGDSVSSEAPTMTNYFIN